VYDLWYDGPVDLVGQVINQNGPHTTYHMPPYDIARLCHLFKFRVQGLGFRVWGLGITLPHMILRGCVT
jgi:hypothetical protein